MLELEEEHFKRLIKENGREEASDRALDAGFDVSEEVVSQDLNTK